MEKTYKYHYKRYMNGLEDNLSHKIKANTDKEALLKIVIEHQGIIGKDETERLKNAEEFVANKAGDNWDNERVFDSINPLGSSDYALYRIDEIVEVKRK